MKLPTAYSRVIRYGLLPRNSLEPWFESIHKEETVAAHNGSSSEYPFADFLQDNEDPRHHVVSKDLKIREKNTTGTVSGFFSVLNKEMEDLTGTDYTTKTHKSIIASAEHGSIQAGKYSGNKGVGYRVYWYPPHDNIPPYLGNFAPEEFENFLRELGSPLTPKDFN